MKTVKVIDSLNENLYTLHSVHCLRSKYNRNERKNSKWVETQLRAVSLRRRPKRNPLRRRLRKRDSGA
jgi:hypothetical protein